MIAFFDLDHTLLRGDSDVLWCDFLAEHELLPDPQGFLARNAVMASRYSRGEASPAEFCGFYVGTLAGRTPEQWRPWIERFLHESVLPRISPGARDLLARHRDAGDTLVLTTATNRVISEPTARRLGFEHLIATEVGLLEDGRYSGRTRDVLNMRDGKLTRARRWLHERGLGDDALASAAFYSDSINDLPLLSAVGRAVAVHPDERLLEEAGRRGWEVLFL